MTVRERGAVVAAMAGLAAVLLSGPAAAEKYALLCGCAVYDQGPNLKPADLKTTRAGLPSLEELTPSRYARLNAKQRKEMTIKLIEFLKTF